jgi:hypothetical protein
VGPEYLPVTRINKSRYWYIYASNPSLRITQLRLYDYPITVWRLMHTKQPPVTVIRYDFMVNGLGQYALIHIVTLNYNIWLCYNTYILGKVHYIIHPIIWFNCQMTYMFMTGKPRSSNDRNEIVRIHMFTRDRLFIIPYVYQCFRLIHLYHGIKLLWIIKKQY